MDHAFWKQRWEEGRTGWHRDSVNPWLVRYLPRLAPTGHGRILLPLCGKSLDLAHLAGQGFEALGVELVERPVRAFFSERGLTPEESEAGALRKFTAGGVTVLQGDIFDTTAEHLAGVIAVFDRAAMIALPPQVRSRYVGHLRGLLGPGTRILLSTLAYDQSRAGGPPFSVPEDEVRRAYDGCTVEILERDDQAPAPPRFMDSGIETLVDTTYLITLGEPG